MGFSPAHISIANLFDNGHNYITFSIMGMLIVFAGLSFISIYIILLSKILNLPRLMKSGTVSSQATTGGESAAEEPELLLAIAVALHLEGTQGFNYEKITWKRHDDRESPWRTAGRMRAIAVRSHLPDRRSPGE